MNKKARSLLFVCISLVLASLITFAFYSFVSAAPLFSGVGIINNTDIFYSPYEYINFSVTTVAAGPDNVTYVQVNLTAINASACGGTGYLNLTNTSELGDAPVIWIGGCAVSTFFNYSITMPTQVLGNNFMFIAYNSTGGTNITAALSPILLHNMGVPNMPPGNQRFGNLTTNMSLVSNFANVNFIIQIEFNGSTLIGPGGGTSPWEGYQQIMMLNFSSLNMSSTTIGERLANLQSALQVNITPPHQFGVTRIYVNETAFAELNTNTTITLNNLPFSSLPIITPDNVSRNATGVIFTSQTPFVFNISLPSPTTVIVPRGTLVFSVVGFSGYNPGDTAKPLITLNNPIGNLKNGENTNVLVNVTINGTGTDLSYVQIALNSSLVKVYNGSLGSTTNTAGCSNISSNMEMWNCVFLANLSIGTYTMNATVWDFGGSYPGNYNTSTLIFTVDTSLPQLNLVSPANGTYQNSSVTFMFNATDANTNVDCNLYLDNATGSNNFTIESINMSINPINVSGLSGIGQGLHNWSVECFDVAGNYNASEVRYFIVDTIKPFPNITSLTNGQNLSNVTISINVSVIEANYNYSTIALLNSSGSSMAASLTNISKNFNVTINAPADGNYIVNVTSYDLAGNTNSTLRSITVDTTAPIITITNPVNNSVYYVNQSILLYFSATDALTSITSIKYNYNITTNITSSSISSVSTNISYNSSGLKNIIFYANDSVNNLATRIIQVNISDLPTTSFILNDTTYNVSSSVSNIIVTYNSTIQNITLTNTSQIVSMDLSQLLSSGNVTLGSNSFNLVTQGTNNYSANIPNGTIISGGSSWDGKITLPTINISTFTAPSSGTTNIVVQLGSTIPLNFSQPVKIIIGGMAGKSAAWSSGSTTLTTISTLCNNLTNPTNIDATTIRECYIDSGSDLAIWTYHFTSFAAYTPATTTTTTTTSSSGGGSIASTADLTNGYTVTLFIGGVIGFRINNQSHTFILLAIKGNNVTVQLSSTIQKASLLVGESKKFDLTADNIYDILVTVNSAANSTASITLKAISESMTGAAGTGTTAGTGAGETGVGTGAGETGETAVTASNLGMIIWWIIGIIILGALIAWAYMSYTKKKGY